MSMEPFVGTFFVGRNIFGIKEGCIRRTIASCYSRKIEKFSSFCQCFVLRIRSLSNSSRPTERAPWHIEKTFS